MSDQVFQLTVYCCTQQYLFTLQVLCSLTVLQEFDASKPIMPVTDVTYYHIFGVVSYLAAVRQASLRLKTTWYISWYYSMLCSTYIC